MLLGAWVVSFSGIFEDYLSDSSDSTEREDCVL